MPLVVYFDEVGNPTLDDTDKDFPVFAIAMFICDSDHYINAITPRINTFKFQWFGHEGSSFTPATFAKRKVILGF